MVKAIWKGKVIAKSDKCEMVEGNYYFPPDSVKKEFLKESEKRSTCPWKGEAYYYDVEVSGEVNEDAAQNIKDYVAFWNGVKVEE